MKAFISLYSTNVHERASSPLSGYRSLKRSFFLLGLCLIFFVWAIPSYADAPFSTGAEVTTTAAEARSVYAGDIDGDGDIDLLSASAQDDTIAWYNNTAGDGSAWSSASIITTSADVARSVFAADIDGDGNMDVLSASSGDDTIDWYKNNGAGSFSAQNDISTSADGAWAVYAADIDGDGNMDVLSASSEDDKVIWYENVAGTGSTWIVFDITALTGTTADYATSVFAADIDGDGDMDVLSSSAEDKKIAWYKNTTGDGSAWTANSITTSADGAWSVYAADIDGDGDMDVLSASRNDDKVAWYENTNGDGSAWTARNISTSADGATSVHAADVDGDGDMDVISASHLDDTIAWYENKGGSPISWTAHTLSTTADWAISVHAADVDGDGDLDVMSASAVDHTITWYENITIHRSALFPTEANIATNADGATAVYAADVDGDGDLDVLSASEADDTIAWYANDGSWTATNITTTADGARSVFAGDVDGDGDLDALSASFEDDKVAWYENTNGDGSAWTAHNITTSADGARYIYAVDMDSDGDLDVLSASETDDTVAWYENAGVAASVKIDCTNANSDITYTARAEGASGNSISITYVDPLANDQTLSVTTSGRDITVNLATDSGGNITSTATEVASAVTSNAIASKLVSVAVEGDGSGVVEAKAKTNLASGADADGLTWTGHTISNSAVGATSVHAADIDGDGDLDALSFSYSDDNIAWYENTAGDGSAWTEHTITTVSIGTESIYAADIDGDGDLDVLSASETDDTIAWYENKGGSPISWTTHNITTSADGAQSVYAADVDGDGDLDVLSASETDDTIAWYENTEGDGSEWTPHNITTAADGAISVFSADIDGDEDIDVISASSLDNTIAWYENQGGQFALATTDTAPTTIVHNGTDDMLKIVATHRGRTGDSDIELATFDLLFEDDTPTALTDGEANALIANLLIYLDDGSGDFDKDNDTLVTTVATLSLTAGVETVTFTDGDTNVQVAYGTPRTYFVAAELTSDAATQTPNKFRSTHDTTSSSTAEDRAHDIALSLEYVADKPSSYTTTAHIITASAGANGSIAPSGEVGVINGANQSFTITADTNYHISDVTVDGSSVGAVATYDFKNVTADHTISATFAIDTYTITVTAGENGSISPSGPVTVNHGDDQTFTITPDSGYGVQDVTVDGTSAGAVTTYTFENVTANHTIESTFSALPTYTITASAGDNGSISPSGDVTVAQGENQTFTITPDEGYGVEDVKVDGSSVGAVTTYTFTNVTADHVTADHTIEATFTVIPTYHTITASAGDNGSILPLGAVTLNHGADQTFTITPDEGYGVEDVKVDGSSVGAVTTYTFTNVTADHSPM